jgi:O-acetylhomoserine/O-acetylserine sulfhydrylase-like pyridoxal-dependent enzyme
MSATIRSEGKPVPPPTPGEIEAAKLLSPLRSSTRERTLEGLSAEQLGHFGIDPGTDFGRALMQTAQDLYRAQADVHRLWQITLETIGNLDRKDRVAYFNAKKFLCFQMAKVLDTLQNPFRRAYQSLSLSDASLYAKGPYPVFDNVTAIFSATPVVVRTATYIYACTEWVDDAFKGKELLHEIYSRLLNPTSISLANHIVDAEAGPHASEYLAWNFNSGMAAIDAVFGHLLCHGDVVLASRNIYGGTYQLLHDHYGRKDKLGVALEWFDGYDAREFAACLEATTRRRGQVLANGGKLLVYLESPCNPHGYVLDVPAICRSAHERGHEVVLDSTIATPFLNKPLRREDRNERPDFVIHSYTKDLTGNGSATAGVVIGENHRMFLPKGESARGVSWDETLFWSVYYVKGAFLDADKAFEVLSGMKTLELRMLQKSINTLVLARALDRHPDIRVNCNAVEGNPNARLRASLLELGLPAPLFTVDFEGARIPREAFVSFFDMLSPAFDHQVSLGQSNTVVLCPALTSHSELGPGALEAAGISPSTIRISVGHEDPRELHAHFVGAARLALEPHRPGFCDRFSSPEEMDGLYAETYLDVHRRYVERLPKVGQERPSQDATE